jgi:hypothetical protein
MTSSEARRRNGDFVATWSIYGAERAQASAAYDKSKAAENIHFALIPFAMPR